MKKVIDWTLPIKTVSETNTHQHWTVSSKRHANQKRHIIWQFLKEDPPIIKLPCHIKLTRYAPRYLDKHDNLPTSFKWIVDAICDKIIPGKAPGRADDSEEISFEYDQMTCRHYAIRIEIFES